MATLATPISTEAAPRLPAQATAPEAFWSLPAADLFAALGSSPKGLTTLAAGERLARVGPNRVTAEGSATAVRLLVSQFRSPLVLILVVAASVALFLREWVNAATILAVIAGSTILGFTQEYRASRAVLALRRRLAMNSTVIRGGTDQVVAATTLVPGDVVRLAAGSLIPGDGLLIDAEDFLVEEASLTGESFPVEKRPGVVAASAPIATRTNAVFAGSSVRSGTATVLLARTGPTTVIGGIAAELRSREPETEFRRGLKRFGATLTRIIVVTVLLVLASNLLLGRPLQDALLFALALAVGLSPELLPAVVTITLARGSLRLARQGVLVRRLEAIENLGSIDVLCADKTGTLTEGRIVLQDALDPSGAPSPTVLQAAFFNGSLQAGMANPLDHAIVALGTGRGCSSAAVRKIDELPYDFRRRRLTVVIDEGNPGQHRIICKGAFDTVLQISTSIADSSGTRPLDDAGRDRLRALFRARGEAGYRVLALAERQVAARPVYRHEDEADLTFTGFLLFLDPPRAKAASLVAELAGLGIVIKIVNGDNRYVTAHVAQAVGIDPAAMLTGDSLATMTDEALGRLAPDIHIFCEVDPQQKERIVRALQHAGASVGYLGDGINDASALHAADVGISVEDAVDVAREGADVVLVKADLDILRDGIVAGRRDLANTLKYIRTTISANFGNIISMAAAAPLLPFLPLLPGHILLNNFLSDLPYLAIAGDNIDPEDVVRPQRWDIRSLNRFMIFFGLLSSAFDLIAFAVLYLMFDAPEPVFHTAWFFISLMTELLVLMILRTRLPVWKSRPSLLLVAASATVAALLIVLLFLPGLMALIGLAPLTPGLLATSLGVIAGYVVAAEAGKLWFFRPRHRHPVDAAETGAANAGVRRMPQS